MKYSINEYHALRNKIWDDLVSSGVTSDEDENFKAFDSVLGNHLAVDWETQSWDEDVEALTGIRQKLEALEDAVRTSQQTDWEGLNSIETELGIIAGNIKNIREDLESI